MKTRKAVVLSCLLIALFLGVASGAAMVMQTVQTYSGACATLSGFPGFLQRAGFVPAGDCPGKPKVPDDCRKHRCIVDGKAGHCVAEFLPPTNPESNNNFICACKPNRPSR